MTTPGIGIIGPGAIGHAHAHALTSLGVPVVAVAGPNQADLTEFARTHRVPNAYQHSADLLADPGVGAVIVAAPSSVHTRLSRESLAAGKPVLCEVPVALDAADAQAAVDLAVRLGLPFGVAHTLRYWEPHRLLVDELARAEAPALHVAVRSMQLRQADVGWSGRRRDWTDSAVWHHGSHAVDAALWLLGDTPARGACVHGDEWTNGSIMDAAFHIRTQDGRIGTVNLSYHARRPKSDFLVVTEANTWEIDGATLYRDGQVMFDGAVSAVQTQAIISQDEAFLRAVDGDPEGFFSAEQALPALQVLATSAIPG